MEQEQKFSLKEELLKRYQIIDAKLSLQRLMISFIFLVIGVVFYKYAINYNFLILISLLIVSISFFFNFLIIKEGVVIDLEKNIITIPGGGVVANKISDFFTLRYIFQNFIRFTCAIAEIRLMSMQNTIKPYSQHSKYYLTFNGDFGTVVLKFLTKGKRDELYSLMTVINKMGEPILINS